MKLDIELSKKAIQEKIAEPLGTTMVEAAFGIHDLINETMAAAAKTHIAEKGGNPNLVTVTAFGGAGPVHTYGLAKKSVPDPSLSHPLPVWGRLWVFLPLPWRLTCPEVTEEYLKKLTLMRSKPFSAPWNKRPQKFWKAPRAVM